jgi:hypothetical protein
LIHPYTYHADLITSATAIIWEEAAGANVAVFDAIHDICCLLKHSKKPFGGIPMICLGDFRQVAPVVKGNSPTAALLASIKSSHLWPSFQICPLQFSHRGAQDPEYTAFVDSIGEDFHHN